MNEIVSKTVDIFRSSTLLQDAEIYQTLVVRGVQPDDAGRLVEFLPMVYCRLIFADRGVRFSDTFRRILQDGSVSQEQPFSSQPVWNAAMTFAREEIKRGVLKEDLLAIAGRSAEYDAVNQLLQKGSKLQNIVLTTPVLNWPEFGPEIRLRI